MRALMITLYECLLRRVGRGRVIMMTLDYYRFLTEYGEPRFADATSLEKECPLSPEPRRAVVEY